MKKNVAQEAEDAVTELVSTVFGEQATAYTDVETGSVSVAVYCEGGTPSLGLKRTHIAAGLSRIRKFGLDAGTGRISVRRIRSEDWAESWKRHFKTIAISPSLLIKPSWVNFRARKQQTVIVLDPGLSFGTGHHPTTAYCLAELEKSRRARQKQSFLDIGTGSGILAITAAKLGYSPVRAADIDPEAVRVARANARANGVSAKIQFNQVDMTRQSMQPPRHYDLICANLISTLLISEGRNVVRLLAPNGILVLAGILDWEFQQVVAAYHSLGLRLASSRSETGWHSGTFVRRK